MKVEVKRLRLIGGDYVATTDPPRWRKCNLLISDNYAMLSGPSFGHWATGDVRKTSTAYAGADYHFSVEVLVLDDALGGRRHAERWFVRCPPAAEPEEN